MDAPIWGLICIAIANLAVTIIRVKTDREYMRSREKEKADADGGSVR